MSDRTDANTSAEKRPFRPADIYLLRSVSDVTLHPDGATAVAVVGWPDKETDSNRANLYRVDIDGGNLFRLTEGHGDRNPTFSPDGSKLAFTRSEPKQPGKLMVLDWPIGEVRQVAEFGDGGPAELSWIDNERLLALAPQRPEGEVDVDDEELARRPKVITSFQYRFNGLGYMYNRPNQIWLIDTAESGGTDKSDDAGKAKVALGKVGVDHSSYALSPDRSTVVAAAPLDDSDGMRGTQQLIRYDLSTDDDGGLSASVPTTISTDGGWWGHLLWHPGGRLLGIGSIKTDTIEFSRIFEIDPTQPGEPTLVAFDDINISGRPRPIAGGVLTGGNRSGRVAVDRYELAAGSRSTVYEDDNTVLAFDTVDDGATIVAAVTSTQRPAELWRIVDGTATKILALNDDVLAEIDLAITEAVTVTSADGTEVEAFVTRPPASAPDTGSPRPGLVYVHGGPMFQYGHFFFDEFQMAAATGYVVIGGNPRGSDGYGEGWAQDIIANYGNRDWEDVQAITSHLADLPEVDADRIGIGGGSYGGFMTSWALGHDDAGRYKAGLVERAVTDFVSFAGTSDIGHFFVLAYLGATIESDLERVQQQSPLTFAHNIKAPTLILHSEHDWRCPIEQAERLYVAIRRNGTPASLVRFPNENHELSRSGQPNHRVERFEIIHEFYAHHLGGAHLGTNHFGFE